MEPGALFHGGGLRAPPGWSLRGGDAGHGCRAMPGPGRLGRWAGARSPAGRVPLAWPGLVGVDAGRGGSRYLLAGRPGWFATWGRAFWVRQPAVVGSVVGA